MARLLSDTEPQQQTPAAAVAEDIVQALRASGRLQRGDLAAALELLVETCANALSARAAVLSEYSRDRTKLETRVRHVVAEPAPERVDTWTATERPELFTDLAATAAFVTRSVPGSPEEAVRPLRLVEQGATKHIELHAPLWVGGRQYGLLSVEAGTGPLWNEDARRCIVGLADLAANAIEHWQRREAQRALAESEDRFQVVAETSGAAIFSFDDRIRFCNDALSKLLGWRRDEIIGRPFAELLPESVQGAIAVFRDSRESGATRPVTQELEVMTRDGGRCWLLVSAGVTIERGEAISLATGFDITDRKRQETELRDHAYRDELTQLPNRALFRDRVARQQETGGGAVILVDIDRFKDVNNALGRDFGDQLLIAVARRLEQLLRDEDTVARLNGDVFGLLLPGITGLQTLERIARRIMRGCGKTILLGEHPVHVTVSLGIRPDLDAALSADGILADAEVALQQARNNGHGGFALFTPNMLAGVKRTLTLSTELRQALDRAEFRLALQPIVSLASKQLVGFEALLRWARTSGGFVSPQEFIPLAEESGLIIPIGDWVISEACSLLAHWYREFPDRHIALSVNVSGRQLHDPGFIQAMRGHLRLRGIDPTRLKVELTESILMEHTKEVLTTLQRLKRLGVGLSLDDFGTGYSSLGYLHRFPFDVLKIDRSFVEPLDEAAPSIGIVDTILALGRTLQIEVVAEGIETASQLERLAAMGCACGQGYYLARPLDPDAAEALLRRTLTLPESP